MSVIISYRMNRREILQSTFAGFTASLAGCTGHTRLSMPESNHACADSLVPVSAQFNDLSYNSVHGFRLTTNDDNPVLGSDITFSLVNTTDENQPTGSKNAYTIQRKEDGSWRDLLWTESTDGPDVRASHDPGEGFIWKFQLSQKGLGRDHQVCLPVTAGIYRFVYFGGLEPALAIQFVSKEA